MGSDWVDWVPARVWAVLARAFAGAEESTFDGKLTGCRAALQEVYGSELAESAGLATVDGTPARLLQICCRAERLVAPPPPPSDEIVGNDVSSSALFALTVYRAMSGGNDTLSTASAVSLLAALCGEACIPDVVADEAGMTASEFVKRVEERLAQRSRLTHAKTMIESGLYA